MKTTLLMTFGIAAFALALGQARSHAQDTTPPFLVSAASLDGISVSLCFSEAMSRGDLDELFTYVVEDEFGPAGYDFVSIRTGDGAVLLRIIGAVSSPFIITIQSPSLSDRAGNPLPLGASVTGMVSSAGWTLADVGGPSPAGSLFSCIPGHLDIDASGRNIGETADQFTYLHRTRTNNFDVRVRVDGLLNVGHPTAKAGIHIRQSLDAASPFFMVYVTPTNGANRIRVRARLEAGQNHVEFPQPPPVDAFPLWLRVKGSRQSFTSFYSRDGQIWLPVGEALGLWPSPAVMLVGLGTVSHVQGVPTTAEYRDFGDTLLHPDAQFTITQQPTNTTLEANQNATFRVAATVTGAPTDALEYQWQAEDSPGSGVFTNAWFATATSYTIPFLRETYSGTRVRVLVSISGHPPVVSAPAVLTVGPDISAPHAVSAVGTHNLREIAVTFSEPLDPFLAQQPANYTMAGFMVISAVLDGTGRKVVLTLNARQSPGSTNVVQIADLRDLAGRLMNPNPQSLSSVAFVVARGFARQELYFDIPSHEMANLRSAEKFPAAPDESSYVSLVEGPLDAYDNYGTRISGFLVPPVTTNYHFFLCSDDQGELWLSTDEEPANLVRLCREPIWMDSRGYTNITGVNGSVLRNASAPENRSSTLFPAGIPLVAGRMYYFEALAKEGGGDDNLAVAWQLPGMPLPESGSSPIPSEFLAVLAPAGGTVQILQQPRDSLYDFNPPPPETVFVETFSAGNGGYTVANDNAQGPWTFNAANGYWFANGSVSSASTLTSPQFTVPQSGPLILRFNHRYSFEYDGTRWDGGQVRLRVNGGPFQPVGTAGFCAQGYAGIIRGDNALNGQMGFNGDSPGYTSGSLITSAANLGHFNAGDVLQIQFLAAWDEIIQSSPPNWLIDQVSLDAGECAARVTFSVMASASVPGESAQPLRYQWQRNCGTGFTNLAGATAASYSFVPAVADLACQFRAIVATLGMSITSAVARVTITPPQVAIRRVDANVVISWGGPGTLQNAQNVNGPWAVVGGVITNTYSVRPTATRRFYRVRIP